MTVQLFVNPVDEVLGSIEPTLAKIEFERAESEARELHESLRRALISLMTLLERDPGIETATADLYAAATALTDPSGRAGPAPRKLRLFRDARARFRDRLARARPSEYGTRPGWRLEELLLSA
ncbi:MAG TPA: hypothetical protein VHG30_11640 [Microvirga sp.]|jgi:hypothetical protein|nr:hypothetical protein [Microvirga sp.]